MAIRNLESMLRRFGDRVTATQSESPSEADLSLKADEFDRYTSWATGFAPPDPMNDPFHGVAMPSRLGANAELPRGTDILEQASWYGAKALFTVLSSRGVEVTFDDCQAVATLSHFRPFGLMTNLVTQLYRDPANLGVSQLSELQKAIKGTEEWLGMLHESKAFQATIEHPISAQDFANALRNEGANNDPYLASLVTVGSRYGSNPLMPGGAVFINLREVTDFYLDTPPGIDGQPACKGMREFALLLHRVVAKNNPAVKEVVGRAIEREISDLIDPIAQVMRGSTNPEHRATGHLIFLRDGLLRLCNRHLAALYAAAVEVPMNREIIKILEALAPDQTEREQIILRHSVDLNLINDSKRVSRALSDYLPTTQPADRRPLFNLFVTAPCALECFEILAAGAKPSDVLNAVPLLVKPLPFTQDGRSLAQLIVETHQLSPGLARSLFDYRDFFTNQLCLAANRETGSLLLALLQHETRGGAKLSKVTPLITEAREAVVLHGDSQSALAALQVHAARAGLPPVTSDLLPLLPSPSPFQEPQSRNTASSDQTLRRNTVWASWAFELLETPASHAALRGHLEAHGSSEWFRTLLFCHTTRTPYFAALNAGDIVAQAQCLDAALATTASSLPLSNATIDDAPRPIAHYHKIVFIGGYQDVRRESDIRKLLPPACDVRFYYGDAGPSSFKNLSPAALSGGGATLVVYRPNFTGHSMYYRAVDVAESAGSTFIVLPKGVQNPNIIIARISEALKGREAPVVKEGV